MDGICLQVLLTGGDYDAEYAREMLARVMEPQVARVTAADVRPPWPGP